MRCRALRRLQSIELPFVSASMASSRTLSTPPTWMPPRRAELLKCSNFQVKGLRGPRLGADGAGGAVTFGHWRSSNRRHRASNTRRTKMDKSACVMQCMEIIGGNRAERQTIAAPGLDIWVDSRPLGLGKGGGDVHYISTCGAGYVTRLALADIAGHGESVDGF